MIFQKHLKQNLLQLETKIVIYRSCLIKKIIYRVCFLFVLAFYILGLGHTFMQGQYLQQSACVKVVSNGISGLKISVSTFFRFSSISSIYASMVALSFPEFLSQKEHSCFDSSAFKKVHGELYKAFCKATNSKRFTISV